MKTPSLSLGTERYDKSHPDPGQAAPLSPMNGRKKVAAVYGSLSTLLTELILTEGT